jgi:predicted metal-dependent hydrolase
MMKIHIRFSLPEITSTKITLSEKRWGSCSAKNGLCFSYRLGEYLGGKEEFIDAIIVHELAHLREKNHQKPFWNLVYSMMPTYEVIMKHYTN